MASATDSKFAIPVPPSFLISSTTSSAGAALVPDPSAATPGSLTTTLAPSVAHSSAIARPIPRPAPVTMMTLSWSDLVIGDSSLVVRHSGMVRSTGPQMCNCTSGNLEILRCAIAHHSSRFARPGMTKVLAFVRKNDRPGRREHAADAVADRDLRARHLRRRDAAHLPHALLQRIHAVHAGMHVA